MEFFYSCHTSLRLFDRKYRYRMRISAWKTDAKFIVVQSPIAPVEYLNWALCRYLAVSG